MDTILNIPRGEWHRVSHLYTPDDNYTHLVFGNLLPQKETTLGVCEKAPIAASNITSSKEAYYYLDDFFMARAVANFRNISSNHLNTLKAINSADLLFETKSTKITSEHTQQLNAAWEKVKTSNIINISIRGYADNTGSKLLNDSLSSTRAKNAKAALESIGAPSDIIKITGYGSTGAKADNSTVSGRERNRRVEITFNIQANSKESNSGEFDKYQANDRSKMIGTPLVIAHNHLKTPYPIKALIYAGGSAEPEVLLVNKNGAMWEKDVH